MNGRIHTPQSNAGSILRIALVVIASGLTGCSAVTFPTPGVPVYRLPDEVLAPSKDANETINLTKLGQDKPEEYLIGPGDTLAVWVEGVMGAKGQIPPVRYRVNQDGFPTSTGVPFDVDAKGMVNLPAVGDVSVEGLTISQARDAVKNAYINEKVIQRGFDRVYLTLSEKRSVTVLIMRQESGVVVRQQRGGILSPADLSRFKRGTGYLIRFPAYENDVLNAMVRSGGMPGLDTYNQIRIFKKGFRNEDEAKMMKDQFEQDGLKPLETDREIRIPLRLPPGVPMPFKPEDIILEDGDVVFIEARDPDVFYTGGLLPTAEILLPQNYDLDVIEAISFARGPLLSGGLQPGNFAFNAELLSGELGGPSPTQLTVLRTLPDGREIPIRVDLNKALTDQRERILIQANDVLFLQQTPEEALSRYAANIFSINAAFRLLQRGDATATGTVTVP